MRKSVNTSLFSIILMTLLSTYTIQSQSFVDALRIANNGSLGTLDNINGASNSEFRTLTGNEFEWSKVMGVLYQFDDIRFGNIAVDGSNLLFKDLQDNAKIYLDSIVLNFSKVNYNIKKDQFFTSTGNDSIFVFDFNLVKKIRVSGRTFKRQYNAVQGLEKTYEVLFQGKKTSLLKNYDAKLIQASPNPMVNRSRNKIKINKTYYLEVGGKMMPVKLGKSSLFKTFGDKNRARLKNIISEHKLKLRKEEDVVKLLQLLESNN